MIYRTLEYYFKANNVSAQLKDFDLLLDAVKSYIIFLLLWLYMDSRDI